MVNAILCMLFVTVLLYLVILLVRYRARNRVAHVRRNTGDGVPTVVGFFHPYCNAGGGGERVLWVAIRAIQKRYKNVRCVIYTGDLNAGATREDMLHLARQRFNIVLPRTDTNSLEFVRLNKRRWLEAYMYPHFTLLGQSIGSMYVGLEAMWKFLPDVYVDTMGYAFTLPIFKYLGGCNVGCYVHYPTISTDMLARVSNRREAYNNAAFISRSPTLSYAKWIYYKLFAWLYGFAGQTSQVTMVNSTWTQRHISSLWRCPAHVVYPPCDTLEFLNLPLEEKSAIKTIVSVSQFRPEKDQPLQIKSFAKFLQDGVDKNDVNNYKLVLVGSCRNEEDNIRVDDLKTLCKELEVEDLVDFRLNVSFADLKRSVSEATIGLHTMCNEHFGIGVVELMAGGTIVLAHNSGGPQLDIVCKFNGKQTGYLAHDVTSYANAMKEIFDLSEMAVYEIQLAARESVEQFSDQNFESGFLSYIGCILPRSVLSM